MVKISAKTFAENCIHIITQLRKGKNQLYSSELKTYEEN